MFIKLLIHIMAIVGNYQPQKAVLHPGGMVKNDEYDVD
jgi:hypothetical protein